MTNNSEPQLRPIHRALISVSDKNGIVQLAQVLQHYSVEIVSTGGTATTLRDAGLKVRDISDLTGFPEMMDGRVKTLHPRVHGGLLALRENSEHVAAMTQHGILPIDMVVVNLYPFAETIARKGVSREKAIEQIDIGGPAMIRSAAKNADHVAVVTQTGQYERIIEELKRYHGSLTRSTRHSLARDAFHQTSRYDRMVASYLDAGAEGISEADRSDSSNAEEINTEKFSNEGLERSLPERLSWTISKSSNLRYGENPHQLAALYRTASHAGLANAALLSGKEMSFNNYVDADAAWQLVCELGTSACAIIKHTNPAGAAIGTTTREAYEKALATDPVSAFGGIVAFNVPVDETTAKEVTKIFTEVVIAPDYTDAAREVLMARKNLRVVRMESTQPTPGLEYKQISGGMLVQTRDSHRLSQGDLKVVTKRSPTSNEIDSLLFAWIVCKHTKSNAIVYARDHQTVGVGAGQMSRVDSVKIGAMRAQLPLAGSVVASDAFFPFRDGLDEAAKHGITAIIQPGGSVRDEEVITAANEHQLAMVFTGIRHFKH